MLKLISMSMMLILGGTYISKYVLIDVLVPMVILFVIMVVMLIPKVSMNVMLTKIIYFDFLSLSLILLTLWVSMLMVLASVHANKVKMLSVYISILTSLLIVSFLMNSFLLFFIFFELVLIPTLLLILGWGSQPERLQAGSYLILYTVSGSLPLLASFMYMYKVNFSLKMFYPIVNLVFSPFFLIWWLGLVIAFMIKFPLYFFHLWLPKAHVEAPVSGSMILAGILLKLGGYGIIRVLMNMWWVGINTYIGVIFFCVSIWGAVMTGLICVRQSDLKALIAYSSVGHMGLIIAALMSGKWLGWQGSLMLMIGHGLCSSGLFSLANLVYNETKSRSMIMNKGLMGIFPKLTIWWFILACVNMGAPPSMNLLSEVFLMASILSSSLIISMPLIISVLIVGGYSLVMYSSTQHGLIPKYMNSLSEFSANSNMLIIMHIWPLYILPLKFELCMF